MDGGVICNNPAYYAWALASKVYKKKNIRMISLGTGEKSFTNLKAEDWNWKNRLVQTDEFLMNIETYTSDWGLYSSIKDPKTNYVRSQTVSNLSMDKIDQENIDGLKQDGLKLWERDQEKIKTLLRLMIDD